MRNREEQQYIDLLHRLLEHGDQRIDRTGVGTRSLSGEMMKFDLSAGAIPIMTTKKVAWKTALREMLWFIRGETNIRSLLVDGCRIWTDWPLKKYRETTGDDISQADFEARIVEDEAFAEEWGDCGPIYGAQWRAWRDADGRVHDQLAMMIETLKTDPASRRMIFHGWNVGELDQMILPPCHLLYAAHVSGLASDNPRVNITLFQRSADATLGLPFNINGLAALTHMIAAQVEMKPGTITWMGHDVHLYSNAEAAARIQIERTPRPFPKLKLLRRPDRIEDYQVEDFEVTGYDPHPPIKIDVAV